jgi:hypothetical protein|tara:strand:+ start:224 stop:766 length:543 start_codon:yes stop_codon:yes gene_type:complete
MALFGGGRDVSLFRHINKELINDIVQTEVDIYKTSLYDTKTNLYGEALRKTYFSAVRVACLISIEDQAWEDADGFGPDVNQAAEFAFLRDTLKDTSDLVLEVGDIINWNAIYWEVDTVIDNDLFMDRNPQTNKTIDDYSYNDIGPPQRFGWDYSVIVNTHMTRRDRLSIENIRSGIPKNV